MRELGELGRWIHHNYDNTITRSFHWRLRGDPHRPWARMDGILDLDLLQNVQR